MICFIFAGILTAYGIALSWLVGVWDKAYYAPALAFLGCGLLALAAWKSNHPLIGA